MGKSVSGLSSKYKLEKQINKMFDVSNKLLLIELLTNIYKVLIL